MATLDFKLEAIKAENSGTASFCNKLLQSRINYLSN